jgi:deoxyribodipyrimidine photo-lyase
VTLPGHLLFDPEATRIDMRREKYFFGTLMPFLHAAEKSGGKPGWGACTS